MQRREFFKIRRHIRCCNIINKLSQFAFAQSNTPSLTIPPQITPMLNKRLFWIFNKVFKFIPTANTTILGL